MLTPAKIRQRGHVLLLAYSDSSVSSLWEVNWSPYFPSWGVLPSHLLYNQGFRIQIKESWPKTQMYCNWELYLIWWVRNNYWKCLTYRGLCQSTLNLYTSCMADLLLKSTEIKEHCKYLFKHFWLFTSISPSIEQKSDISIARIM